MKRIIKQGVPKELIDFKVKNKDAKQNLDYRNLGSEERSPIKKALLNEQGYLCAYTMKRVSSESCHIEHIKPESLCREHLRQGIETPSDLDYSNMVACFPKDGMSAQTRYGAQYKNDWWDDNGSEFISPLAANCESHFSFNMKGEIAGNSNAAKKTIDVLKLDHEVLVADRKRAIESFIFDKNQKPMSKAKAQTAIHEIIQLHSGKYPEYCVTIKFALQEHIARIDKLAQKVKYIKSAKNK